MIDVDHTLADFQTVRHAAQGGVTMENHTPDEGQPRTPMTRRQMLRFMAAGLGAGAILAACGGTTAPPAGGAPTAATGGGAAPTSAPAAAATAAPAAAATAAPAQGTASRPLTPTFYQWIVDLHPSLPKVNEQFPG